MNPMPPNPLVNPMAQMDPNTLRAQELKQMMMIMGGLGQQVPAQPAGQAMTMQPTGPMNPMMR